MMKRLRKTISSMTLRVFSRNSANGAMRAREEGWVLEKTQAGASTESIPSMDDNFNIAAFYVEGQFNFPNQQVPQNVHLLYHQLHDMEQKVKALENEIAVYVMSFQESNRPVGMRPRMSIKRRLNTTRKCCFPGLWNCSRPRPVISDTSPLRRMRPPVRMINRPRSVSTSVQTADMNGRNSRLSKVSWNSQVDVRYIGGSGTPNELPQRVPLQGAELPPRESKEMKNVVHLKIKIPKDVLNLADDNNKPRSTRLENEWHLFNSATNNNDEKSLTATKSSTEDKFEVVLPPGDRTFENSNSSRTETTPTHMNKPTLAPNNTDRVRLAKIKEDEPKRDSNTIVGSSFVQHTGRESAHAETLGIPVKQPGRASCESKGCNCKGSAKNDDNLDKLRQSFNVTESELSLLEKTVHNSSNEPTELKIQTDYGSVNVISHAPECTCEICEHFGSHNETRRKRSGRSDSAAVISKKVLRVYYNGHYRNIITHTEECGCDICTNIEEHSYKLSRTQRASIVSTKQGDLLVENRGVCGCKNCKTVAMGPHMVNVETMLSKTSSHLLDLCYYSDATIPSIQSFPGQCITASDEPGTTGTSPPSISSADLSDRSYSESIVPAKVKTPEPRFDKLLQSIRRASKKEEIDSSSEKSEEDNRRKQRKCDKISQNASERTQTRISHDIQKPPLAKSSPARLDKGKHQNECRRCSNCKEEKVRNNLNIGEPNLVEARVPNENAVRPSTSSKQTPQANEKVVTQSVKSGMSLKRDKDEEPQKHAAEHTMTLEELIRDLVRGKPGMQKDNVYTVTLGEIQNKPYTKIHIVDCSKSSDGNKSEQKVDDSVKLPGTKPSPNGGGSHSNVFFIKPLPGNELSQIHSSDTVQHSLSPPHDSTNAENRSLSSPACVQKNPSNCFPAVQAAGEFFQRPQTTLLMDPKSDSGARSSNQPKKSFKLTISFGKRMVAFFKNKNKKKKPILFDGAVRDAPKQLKAFTICEGAEKPPKTMEILQIAVKPGYYTLNTTMNGAGSRSSTGPGPVLYLVEKNSKRQIMSTTS